MSRRPLGRWLFGKLPAQGDFVSRGIDHAFRDRLDHWLSHEMEAARAAFPDFEQRYVHAPAWNFVDHDGQAGWSGGALCASVDRVGRRFPLMLAAPAADAAAAVAISAACLGALHEAFVAGWDADSLHAAPLLPGELPWNPVGTEWALVGEDGPAYAVGQRFPEGIVSAMLEMAQ